MESININLLPGESRYQKGVSYYFHDSKELKNLLTEIYSGEEPQAEEDTNQ